jgi:hypothetical protein
MARRPVSVTLDEANLRWLRGRARVSSGGNLSDALDRLITAARSGGAGRIAARSVIGTVDLPVDDPELAGADEAVRALVAASLTRSWPGVATPADRARRRRARPGGSRRRG